MRIILSLLSITMLISFSGCSNDNASGDLEKRNMAVVRQTHIDLAAGNFEAFAAAIAPNYVRHCQAMPPGLQELEGTEMFMAFLKEFVTAVPGYQDSLSEMFAQGDKVAYISTMTGTQTGPLGDLPASGKTFTLVNIIIQRLENGKIAETWVSWDNVSMLSQLGFMP